MHVDAVDGKPPSNSQDNLANGLIAFIVATLVLVAVPVCLRFYIRLRIIRKVGPDDIALGLTVLALYGSAIGAAVATKYGLGYHYDTLSIDEKAMFLKLVFFSSLGYHGTVMLLKAAFLLQYRRVFPLPKFQLLCDTGLALLAAWTVAGLVGGLLVCLPLSGNWDPRNLNWNCDRRLVFWTAHGVAHVVSDVLILVMPMPLLRTLPLPRVHKIILIGLFSLGFV
ncbi:hypothetical protein VTJ49DRAFT_2187 [Mycothermus thermophilus]|uniref:Rhodopsin domain-containing protein n=1 Tax=Humicola insolens TaxID=85995 RepID=A0ABR3VAG6_HUMIN